MVNRTPCYDYPKWAIIPFLFGIPFVHSPYEFDDLEHRGGSVPQGALAEEEAEDPEVDFDEDEALRSDLRPSLPRHYGQPHADHAPVKI